MHMFLVDSLIKYGFITNEERENYQYGVEVFLLKSAHFSLIIFMSVILNCLLEGIFFLIIYSDIRGFIGGYHAKKRLTCFMETILIISLLFLLVSSNLVLNGSLIILLFSLLTSISIYINNKKRHFINMLLIRLLFFSLLTILFYFLSLNSLLISVSYALFVSLALSVIQK